MALQLYTDFNLFVDGQLLAEMVSITIDHKNNAQPIHTVAKGFAGMSPGANETQLKVDNVTPRKGVEFDARASMQSMKVHEFTIFRGSKKVKCKGFITDVSEGGGANKEASYSFSAMCSPVEESTL